MRHLPALALALALAVALTALPLAAARESRVYLFAERAHASFSSTVASGCVRTTVDLLGLRLRTKLIPADLGSWRHVVKIFITQDDTCTGAELLWASEGGPPVEMRLQVSDGLASGSLNAIVPATVYPERTADQVTVHLS